MKYKACLIPIVLSILFARKQEKNPTGSPLGYQFESCPTGRKQGFGKAIQSTGNGWIILGSFNDTIRVVHANARYNCLGEIKRNVVETGCEFELFEKDERDTCMCMCYSEVLAFIYNLFA